MKKKKSNIRPSVKGSHNRIQHPKVLFNENSYADLIGLAMIILLGIIIYSNSFKCSFHLDDMGSIVENMKIRNLSDVKAWWNYAPARPIGYFTFALNYYFNQLDVTYYHIGNLMIHLINACLVWWLTLLIFSSPALKDYSVSRQKKIIAFLTALLFVSHPLATESVTYIVQRLASMAAMFYLLSLSLYVYARLMNKNNVSRYLLFAGSLVSALAALLTRENAFTLPFVILLFEIFFFQKKKLSISIKDIRIIFLIVAFLILITLVLFKFSLHIFNPLPPSNGSIYTITPLNYLLTQFSVIVKYVQLLFLPVNQNLDYDFPVSNHFFELRTILSFLLLLTLISLTIFLFKKNRIISFGILWFFLTLSVESSIVPINDVIFEHRTYLPSFGFFLILSSGIYVLLWNKYKFMAIAVFILIIGSNSYMTYQRNKVWKDNLTLWSDAVSKSPNKARPVLNRGFAYEKLGQTDKAIADYSMAIRNNPKYANAYFNRGAGYATLGKWDLAIADYTTAIDLDPKYVKAFNNRGVTYGNQRQWDKAIDDYTKTVEIDPKYFDAYFNRGDAYSNLGMWNEAINSYSKAIDINPKYAKAYDHRGNAYSGLKQLDRAITDYTKAIELDPKNTEAYSDRGIAYGNLGQWGKSIADFSKAIEIDPEFKAAYSNREIAYKKLNSEKK